MLGQSFAPPLSCEGWPGSRRMAAQLGLRKSLAPLRLEREDLPKYAPNSRLEALQPGLFAKFGQGWAPLRLERKDLLKRE